MATAKTPEKGLDRRAKTDIRMSVLLQKVVGDLTKQLGIPKNSYYTMAAASHAARLSILIPGAKTRAKMLDKIQLIFDDAMDEARKSL